MILNLMHMKRLKTQRNNHRELKRNFSQQLAKRAKALGKRFGSKNQFETHNERYKRIKENKSESLEPITRNSMYNNLRRNSSSNNFFQSRCNMIHQNSSPNHKSICIYYDMERSVTDALIKENQKVEKEVDLIFNKENQSLYIQDSNSKLNEQKERNRAFQKVNTQIRDLNAELRRILKTENEQPTLLEQDMWNSFDGIKGEIIHFKIDCDQNIPPLKIKFSKESINCSVYISTSVEMPTKLNCDKAIENFKCHFYYPIRNAKTFNASIIYLSVECLEDGTVHMMLRYKSENFKSNLFRSNRNPSSKRFSDTNCKEEYLNRIKVLEDNEANRKQLFENIEVIKNKRRNELISSNSIGDIVAHSIKSQGSFMKKTEQQLIFNQKRKETFQKVKDKNEEMSHENYKQKLFLAHRKTIESNIRIELRAIKIVRLWQEK